MKMTGKTRQQEMVLLSLMEKTNSRGIDKRDCANFVDIKVLVIYSEREGFRFSLFFQGPGFISNSLPDRALDNAWHFLFVRCKKSGSSITLQLHVDTLDKQDTNFVETPARNFEAEGEYLLALGNNAEKISRMQSY